MPSVQMLIPSTLLTVNEAFIRGILEKSPKDHSFTIYITRLSKNIEDLTALPKGSSKEKYIFGSYNKYLPISVIKQCYNYFEINKDIDKGIKRLIIDNNIISIPHINNVIIYYDYNVVHDSENLTISSSYNDTFTKLHRIIQRENDNYHSDEIVACLPIIPRPSWLSSTMFGQHLLNYVDLVKWVVCCIKQERKLSIKTGNMLLALLIDIILGYLVLQVFTECKLYLSSNLMGFLEKLVNSLFTLLKWLMGAPAGLKLNNAFNKMLGKYFSYHIQLWWLFLDVSGEKLDYILNLYHYAGYLGFTFQAAMVSDMICIATFHSYCIYVYAARLFNIQISGLIALMRLFVGRKYNPLRGGIDSCEYTNQELFVGTVAFTILLFLLPTTTMYYIVFTLFRLLSLSVQYMLTKIIYWIQTIPIYATLLWLIKPSKVAGKVSIEVINAGSTSPLILKMNMHSKSFGNLLRSSKPPVRGQSPIDWTDLLSKLLRGKQIT